MKARWILTAVFVGLAALVAFSMAQADRDNNNHGGTFIVDVLVDVSTFTGPGQPFHVQGPIYPAGTFDMDDCMPTVEAIGFYHCWGHVPATGGPGVVAQEFDLFGWGKIEAQGREGPGATLAVVGGTETFRNARGERLFVAQSLCPGSLGPGQAGAQSALTVEFDLIGAPVARQ